MADTKGLYEVHGLVTGAGGRPLPHAAVFIWWKHIRDRVLLGQAETSEHGEYQVTFKQPNCGDTPILIEVEARCDDLDSPLFSSATRLKPHLQIDLYAARPDTSEWTTLIHSTHPLLDGLKLSDLAETSDHQDISFLSLELSKSPDVVMQVAISARLERTFAIEAPAFFAFIRQRVPNSIPAQLLDASQGFTLIDALVQRIASLIFALSEDEQTRALTSAVALNIVSAALTDQIPDIVVKLQQHRTTDLLNAPYLASKATLAQLLTIAQLPSDKQKAFAEAFASNATSPAGFWATFATGNAGITSSEAAQIQLTLSLATIVQNDIPTIQAVMQRFTNGTYSSLQDLAKLSVQDWTGIIEQNGVPEGIAAARESLSTAEAFAGAVYTRVAQAYPTGALAARVQDSTFISPEQRAPLQQFFSNNGTLDLVTANIPSYLRNAGPAAFDGISDADQEGVIGNLRSLQRVLRVTPSVDSAEALLNVGIDSATKIATMGRQRFVSAVTNSGMTIDEATRICDVAEQRYAGVISTYTRFNVDSAGIWPAAMGDITSYNQSAQEAIQQDPSLATLFGSLSYCAADGCTSILSPAAYLCDLLLWLRKISSNPQDPNSGTVLDVFAMRRPDILNLLLNCPNSETPLPYIDLVNELLADAISFPSGALPPNPQWKQTTADATAETLRAAPQYFNQPAYLALFGASYPYVLPYSAGLDELRTYTQQLGLPLWQIRQALLPIPGSSVGQRASVFGERLGLTQYGLDLIGSANLISSNQAWNTSNIPNPIQYIVQVPNFLEAAGIPYEALLELLQVEWVQGGLAVQIAGVNDNCDTSKETLVVRDDPSHSGPPNAPFWDRAHRFLRLWRATGYTMWELDLLLQAPSVGNGVLNVNAVAVLHSFRRLQDATNLPVDAQLAFFQNIDTALHRNSDGTQSPSLYARLFLNPTVAGPIADSDLAAVASGGSVVQHALLDHLPTIQAALGITAADAAILFGFTDGQLTLANLSLIYRISQLAVAARLTLTDLIAVAALLNPVSGAAAVTVLFGSPETVLEFLTQAAAIKQSPFSIDALTFILAPWSTTESQMTTDQITAALTAVQAATVAAAGVNVDGAVIAAVAANAHAPSESSLANDVSALILQTVPLAVFTPTGDYIFTLLKVLTDPTLTAPVANALPTITQAAFPRQYAAIQLFDKIGIIARSLRLVAGELSWLIANASVYGGLDFTQLPGSQLAVGNVHPPSQPPVSATKILTTLLLVALARQFTAAPPDSPAQTLYDVIGGAGGALSTEFLVQEALATITGWPQTDISTFASTLGVSFSNGDYKFPAVYDSIRRLQAMATTAKASGPQIVNWAAVPVDEPTAEAMAASALGVLKGSYATNEQWLTVAETLMDPIRERRSAALQAYLIAQRNGSGDLVYPDSNALFDYFLIDVQMTACQVTTRVVQAYIAVQIFVERCLMNLEQLQVTIDNTVDDTWTQWQWMKRFRIWQANREVFLYPENWLVESDRPNRTEAFQNLERTALQGQSTSDYLETVVLNYIEDLDAIAHLFVTGTYKDPVTGSIYVVARSVNDPPAFYIRSYIDGAWGGWMSIPLDIKAHHAIPAIYGGRLCLFWLQVRINSEPKQLPNLPDFDQTLAAQDKYVVLTPFFSVFCNGSWAPAESTKNSLFDKPPQLVDQQSHTNLIEELYSIKIELVPSNQTYGGSLFVDVFRLGDFFVAPGVAYRIQDKALHVARVVFDGRFRELEINNGTTNFSWGIPGMGSPSVTTFYNIGVFDGTKAYSLLDWGQSYYGPDAMALLPMEAPNPDLLPQELDANHVLAPQGGALVTPPPDASSGANQTLPLNFTYPAGTLQQDTGPLLKNARIPFRVVGPDGDLAFDRTSYFFFQDDRRCYYVEPHVLYNVGNAWVQTPPSNATSVASWVSYVFRPIYQPFVRLFWNQLFTGGFAALFDRNLQLNPEGMDQTGADSFSFQAGYQPASLWQVSWDHDDVTYQDKQFLDFSYAAPNAVYNWELFFHVPMYIAGLLSQNLQFEDALKWYQYIFNPTLQGNDPIPQRYWVPKPLARLTSAQVGQQNINQLLQDIDQGDQDALNELTIWSKNPFNPYAIADLRPVAYMKQTVMSYLDNLIAWADSLFATDSREALSEATLIYVIASEVLGPQPAAVTPPQHADYSFIELAPYLDQFANLMVYIENVLPGSNIGNPVGTVLQPQTFYFKIPPNEKLLGYWGTVNDRLAKLRHCQNLQGGDLILALFDAPIDPGLLVAAQAAGVDLNSVLSGVTVGTPNYRFPTLYAQALDYVDAVRAYGASLQDAITKSDAGTLVILQQTVQEQLLVDSGQVLDLQVERAQDSYNALSSAIDLLNSKLSYITDQQRVDPFEAAENALKLTSAGLKLIASHTKQSAAVEHLTVDVTLGDAGTVGPVVVSTSGGSHAGKSAEATAESIDKYAEWAEKGAEAAKAAGDYKSKQDALKQAKEETQIQIDQANSQLAAAQVVVQIAQQKQSQHQGQLERIETQNARSTDSTLSHSFYNWMVGELSSTYFQSYQLAYRLCKQAEACYQFEIGPLQNSFVRFGYWDSLRKGLLSGEALSHDLRRMQSSYLDQNRRRLEISRYISLSQLVDPTSSQGKTALDQVKANGVCHFNLSASLYDNDYPGHYNRRLVRASVTVVYPNPGRFDNVKGTLTLLTSQVRVDPMSSAGYVPALNAVTQEIVLSC